MEHMFAALAMTLDPAFHVEKTESGSQVISRVGTSSVSSSSSSSSSSSTSSTSSSSSSSSSSGSAASNVAQSSSSAQPKVYKKSLLSLEERVALVASVGEEVVQPTELAALLKAKEHPVCYDGFEPSGRMHIAQGILKAINVNKLTQSGCVFKFWVADWFALLNNKMNGDLKKIRTVGQYMIEVWRAAGMDMDNVEFLWASDEINAHANEYWLRVMDIARHNNLDRIKRCCTIMGRTEEDSLSAAQIFYPCMQCADIFFLKADICQLGMDQRKVNMLAREYCDDVKIKFKPVIVSHHMLMGLKEGQEKMSKSDPDSAIFMEDTAEDVKRKIKKAYCPPGVVEANPCLDWIKHIIFGKFSSWSVDITDPKENKILETRTYTKYEDLEADYKAGVIYPTDLKVALTKSINALLEPVRKHFASGEPAKLLKQVQSYKVTR